MAGAVGVCIAAHIVFNRCMLVNTRYEVSVDPGVNHCSSPAIDILAGRCSRNLCNTVRRRVRACATIKSMDQYLHADVRQTSKLLQVTTTQMALGKRESAKQQHFRNSCNCQLCFCNNSLHRKYWFFHGIR